MSESIKNTIKKYFSKYKISQDYIKLFKKLLFPSTAINTTSSLTV